MNIVIVQTHTRNLDGIRSLMEIETPNLLSKTSFCDTVESALRLVSTGGETIVVTGKVFANNPTGGLKLAEHAKSMHPLNKVYMYSVMPESCIYLDGYITKQDGTCESGEHETLIKFLKSL